MKEFFLKALLIFAFLLGDVAATRPGSNEEGADWKELDRDDIKDQMLDSGREMEAKKEMDRFKSQVLTYVKFIRRNHGDKDFLHRLRSMGDSIEATREILTDRLIPTLKSKSLRAEMSNQFNRIDKIYRPYVKEENRDAEERWQPDRGAGTYADYLNTQDRLEKERYVYREKPQQSRYQLY